MPEMNRFQRFFVNWSAARRAARRYRWIRDSVEVPDGAVCLEVGCGNGEFAARFVDGQHPASYVAIDVDPLQLDEAERTLRTRYPNGTPSSLELKRADMLNLPFPDAAFDVVLTFVALHHASPTHHDSSRVPDALSEIDRVLRHGGLLVYSEIFHKEQIRRWLTDRGYSTDGFQRRFRLESVISRKPSPTS